MAEYKKDHLTFEEQVSLLETRGLHVSDRQRAISALAAIGYYRFSAYTHPMRVPMRPSIPGHDQRHSVFLPNADFDTALRVWEFDRKLKLLLLDGLERFEIALRTAVAYELGKRSRFGHLEQQHLDTGFVSQPPVESRDRMSKYDKWLVGYYERQASASDEAFMSWFDFRYGGKLPIWVAIEILQWGQISQLYSGLQLGDRDAVAKSFGVNSSKQFKSWIASMNDVRNFCAHHARLWNRSLVKQASRPKRGVVPKLDHLQDLDETQSARLYPTVGILAWMFSDVSPVEGWVSSLKAHFLSFPETEFMTLASAGFPDGWLDLELWR
jgi:abortive infection bacteriophage resistance protein